MKKLLLALAICAIFITPAYGTDSVYVVNFGEDNVATGAAGTKTAIDILAPIGRVVKVYGGATQGSTTTSWDIKIFSDNTSGTAQEDTLYSVNNITTGFINDDTPFYVRSTSSTANNIYFQITNDGNEASFDLWLLYEIKKEKP